MFREGFAEIGDGTALSQRSSREVSLPGSRERRAAAPSALPAGRLCERRLGIAARRDKGSKQEVPHGEAGEKAGVEDVEVVEGVDGSPRPVGLCGSPEGTYLHQEQRRAGVRQGAAPDEERSSRR
jgi:hypothetical protein